MKPLYIAVCSSPRLPCLGKGGRMAFISISMSCCTKQQSLAHHTKQTLQNSCMSYSLMVGVHGYACNPTPG